MERNEDCTRTQGWPSSIYCTVPFFHHNSLFRYHYYVSTLYHYLRVGSSPRLFSAIMPDCNRLTEFGWIRFLFGAQFYFNIYAYASFSSLHREYLPHLIPVEVPEPKAREWFRSLLSAVLFLHDRGIVHNDIEYVSCYSTWELFVQLMSSRRSANILLSKKKVPVLIDFGFAERYDMNSKRAFLSNLAYGTPEVRYLGTICWKLIQSYKCI